MKSAQKQSVWMLRVAVVMITVLMLCSGWKAEASAAKISKSSITLLAGKTYTLKVKGANSKVIWKSGNKKVAMVNSRGRVKGRNAGTTMVTASTGNQVLFCSVKVKQPVKKVLINKRSLSLGVGETVKLAAKAAPSSASDRRIRWKSSNKNVVTVNSRGEVKGINGGTATVTAMSRDGSRKKASCRVRVNDRVQATGISLNKKEAELEVGKTLALISSVKPSNATNTAVKWKSSNSRIATVNALGLVTGVSEGTVKIFAVTTDGSNKKAYCKVKVTKVHQEMPQETPQIEAGDASARILRSMAKFEARLQADKKEGIRWHYYRGASKEGRQYAQTFDRAVAEKNRVSDCAILARWALKESGVLKETTTFWWDPRKGGLVYGGKSKALSKQDLYSSCNVTDYRGMGKTAAELEAEGVLRPGDVLCWSLSGGSVGHVNTYAGNGYFYDSGKNPTINTPSGGKIYFETWKIDGSFYMNQTVQTLIRAK